MGPPLAGSMRPLFLVPVFAIVFASGMARARPAPTTAPTLELTTLEGKTVRLADFKGRVLLVDIWASWCGPCKISFPSLDALYLELHAQGLDLLAVNVDERRHDADEFLLHHPHQMPVVLDPRGRVPEAFGADAMPSSFLIDRSGNIRFRHAGYTPASLQVYRQEIATLLEEKGDETDGLVVIGP
jgi:cytochrome c biogenesis protein CcmG/thiol:disulfide interchange protein DsbE